MSTWHRIDEVCPENAKFAVTISTVRETLPTGSLLLIGMLRCLCKGFILACILLKCLAGCFHLCRSSPCLLSGMERCQPENWSYQQSLLGLNMSSNTHGALCPVRWQRICMPSRECFQWCFACFTIGELPEPAWEALLVWGIGRLFLKAWSIMKLEPSHQYNRCHHLTTLLSA